MAHDFIPFLQTVRTEMVYFQYGQFCENVLHFRKTGAAPSIPDQRDLASSIVDWFIAEMQPLLASDASLVKIRTKDLTDETGSGLEYVTGLPLTGSSTNPGTSSNVTLAVKWLTGLSGRSYRGRSYQVGLQQARVSNDIVDSDYLEELHQAWLLLPGSIDENWEMVIASSMHNGVWRTEGLLTVVDNCTIDPYVDSQRRRLVGRGQ